MGNSLFLNIYMYCINCIVIIHICQNSGRPLSAKAFLGLAVTRRDPRLTTMTKIVTKISEE